ncbi:hypothetical protein YC2023_094753 [Brassica napus]
MIGSVVYAGQGAFGCDSFAKTFKPKFPRPTILIINRGDRTDGQTEDRLDGCDGGMGRPKDRKMDDGIFVAGRVSLSTRISGWRMD